ncbi:hypothetical protein [Burkholderia pyrrocinia]|uniref:hypothetical protein n=1 Tax=Burkholderia pyrrocinia TaxID=60550 RepID=UPI001BD070E5|nr:hypothetical protein [Burkholderia pyrrocinia]QVN23402.1 hypothetical protein JYG32_33510 [Burkholderia pyrrocinia]
MAGEARRPWALADLTAEMPAGRTGSARYCCVPMLDSVAPTVVAWLSDHFSLQPDDALAMLRMQRPAVIAGAHEAVMLAAYAERHREGRIAAHRAQRAEGTVDAH